MSETKKYTILTISMILTLASSFFLFYLAGKRFIYNKLNLDTMVFVYLALGIISGLLTLIIQQRQMIARENSVSEKIKEGRGKSYANASKSEREELDRQRLERSERVLSNVEFKSLIKKGSQDPEKDLNNLIGISEVKAYIERLEAQMILFSDNKKKDRFITRPSMNMCLLGNAGTGKTTAVGVITGYLYKHKFIKKNEFVAIDGNYLKGGVDPVEKTSILLSRCRGGVLFIDEAYALVRGTDRGGGILETIINEMENHRDELIIIFAGYKKEMKELFDANSGLVSRIKHILTFEDYSTSELSEIFKLFIYKENYIVSLEALEEFESKISVIRNEDYFSNARTVRNIAENSLIEHVYNFKKGRYKPDEKYILQKPDIITKPPQ